MQLLHSPLSPYVRKIMLVAHETGQVKDITIVPAVANPVENPAALSSKNPIGKIPAMILENGSVLYDSAVIAEYVDSLHKGKKMFPKGKKRWSALTLQALSDGLLDAALLVRYETVMRPEEKRWDAWRDGQFTKIKTCFDALEKTWIKHLKKEVDIGTLCAAAAIGYLDFRFPDYDWRKGRPKLKAWYAEFSQRPSMVATKPE